MREGNNRTRESSSELVRNCFLFIFSFSVTELPCSSVHTSLWHSTWFTHATNVHFFLDAKYYRFQCKHQEIVLQNLWKSFYFIIFSLNITRFHINFVTHHYDTLPDILMLNVCDLYGFKSMDVLGGINYWLNIPKLINGVTSCISDKLHSHSYHGFSN